MTSRALPSSIPTVPPRVPRSFIEQLQSIFGHLRISAQKLAQFITALLTKTRYLRFALLAVATLGPAFVLAARVCRTYCTKYGKYNLSASLHNEYDYVIVGAGSAGCVLAARLTEDPNARVLLLESGGSDDLVHVTVPAAANKLQLTENDWCYQTVPQSHSHLSMTDNRSNWPRGRMLGGSSSLNYLLWVRGVREDYDSWEANGAAGWSWADVLPYFKRIEACAPSIPDSPLRGRTGPIHVETLQDYHPTTKVFVEACKQANIPFVNDYNASDSPNGVSYAQYSAHNGRRWNSASGYLTQALNRKNLHVLTHATATKIVFNENREAIGVQYRRGQSFKELRAATDHFVRASKEVLLCGGAINSPHLLMLSGVGPREHLDEHQISVIVNSPGVGQSLYDHLCVPLVYRSQLRTLNEKDESLTNVAKFYLQGKGPLASCGVEAFVFLHSGKRADLLSPLNSGKLPDIQFHYNAATIGHDNVRQTNYRPELAKSFFDVLGNDYTHFIMSTLVRPKSVGSLSLANNDPFSKPNIDPNYLSDETDVAVLVESCIVAETIINQPPMRAVTKAKQNSDAIFAIDAIAGHINPFDRKSDPYHWWAHYVRHTAVTLYHPTSTVRIGRSDDPLAPLTNDFRVKGVDRLRVVDASAMPNIPSGNTNSVVIMMAERAADFIRGGSSIKEASDPTTDSSASTSTVRQTLPPPLSKL